MTFRPGLVGPLLGLVVCSLEAWDHVWRRNQFLVAGLLRRNPGLRVLFVEPPHDLVHGLRRATLPMRPQPRPVAGFDRLWTLQPVKPLPRRAGPWSDWALRRQVRDAAAGLGLRDPVLWVNDTTYGPLIGQSGWPSVYDVTDDWLLVPVSPREHARRRRLEAVALHDADEVVVCSPGLAKSRNAARPTLIPNGVDVEHFTRRRPRPADLPTSPVAVYVGTLHDERIDIELVAELATRLPDLSVALVGPDVLTADSRRRIAAHGNVFNLGARAYEQVPGYQQHADVIIVPHRVTPFTESLDPIKAYECLAVARPTVATQVAGFRELGPPVTSVTRDEFPAQVARALHAREHRAGERLDDLTWDDRCRRFEAVLTNART